MNVHKLFLYKHRNSYEISAKLIEKKSDNFNDFSQIYARKLASLNVND